MRSPSMLIHKLPKMSVFKENPFCSSADHSVANKPYNMTPVKAKINYE